MVYFSADDILKAEHQLLIDAVDPERANSDFVSGYITGIVALAAELTEENKEKT